MRAAVYRTYGGPEVLTVDDQPEPHAGPGSVRIATLAASVNRVDWIIRAGHAQSFLPLEFPAIPGRDAVGVVDEIGDGVTGVRIGDVVFGLTGATGATAEHTVLSAWATPPTTWTMAQAAAAGLASATAVPGLSALGRLDGAILLIDGAAGSVGAAAAAVALSRGARVIGTASERNYEFLAGLGVTPVAYGPGLTDRVKVLSNAGVDLALDTSGAGNLHELIALTGSADSVVTVADGARARELGVRLVNADNNSASLAETSHLGEARRYLPRVAATFSIGDSALAHERAETGSGKVTIEVAPQG